MLLVSKSEEQRHFLALLLELSHIRSPGKVLIKWFVGLSLPPALNCISIDFKA